MSKIMEEQRDVAVAALQDISSGSHIGLTDAMLLSKEVFQENFGALLQRRASESLARIAEVGKNASPSGWQPIKTAPKDGAQILITYRGETLPFWWQQTTFWDNNGRWDGIPDEIHWKYWQPCPDPPQEDKL